MTQPWYSTRPVPVFMTVFYCFIVLIQAGLWVVNDGLEQARQGDISILVLLNICTVALLMFVGGLMLLGRKKSSSWCFILSLVVGVAFSLSQMRSGSIVHLLTLPMFKEYALVFGIWVYSLQLRSGSYFHPEPSAN
ncbi:hypothetical protein [Pseudomonas syringae]|nr:hypothetical protein [Pseudomonas syringae]EPM50749.1 hypothetical protein A246_04520 [Pseudomonas syringae pv. actinidiae ICMP 19098]EPN16318.1 hypothetical protein A249_07007 [Pseudomonas syringae pv. actinidiae ICMP 18804]EPN20871.1 hypothetical protein A248_04933 [Pseudomonas syringae pv. actinidiae ICMP 19100]EPN28441.1 hypothetical protein A247_04782 [Pseudomonas syringae pv. actinidiae ICMP 19099]EPN36741.1 hypothetical protein A243_04967 [Pseudomonas syringae pv. actinidiae ICMP 188